MTAIEFNHQLITLEEKLARFALSLTSNKDDAKDLLQETMLKAITYRDQFVQYTNLKAWTYTIMKNTFINNYRRNVRQNTAIDRHAMRGANEHALVASGPYATLDDRRKGQDGRGHGARHPDESGIVGRDEGPCQVVH